MPHLTQDNGRLIRRVRRLKGQIEGIERMLNEGNECYQILQNVAACRGAFNALTRELIREHIEHHVIEAEGASPETQQGGREIQEIIDSFYLK